mgnify:CR=1 FL=1
MNETLLQVERLTIKLKNQNQELARDISFSLKEAGTITLLGQSGSGKTLTCRAILGLLNRSAFQVDGEILFEEKSLLQLKEKERALYYGSQIAFIPQNPMTALDPSRKIGVQMAEFLRLHRELNKKEALCLCEQAMIQAGLADTKRILNSRPYQLSGGMRQRAALIRTLAMEPDLLLLDEPFSALDYQTRLNVCDDIGKIIKKEGKTAILVTHDISEAISMADRVIVLAARPAYVKKKIPIRFAMEERTPMKARSAPEFKTYFNAIWKELNENA